MFNNNFYILSPPGYYGTYVSWILYKSNKVTSSSTVDNPMNLSQTTQFGGVGTAHGHIKEPTHITWSRILTWRVLNQSYDNRVFVINSGHAINRFENQNLSMEEENHFMALLGIHPADRNPTFINMCSSSDADEEKYGIITQMLKWPTYFLAVWRLDLQIKKQFPEFDAFACNNIKSRNFFVKNYEWMFRVNNEVSEQEIDRIKTIMNHWYTVRHQYQPHEVNEDQYVSKFAAKVINVHLNDVLSNDFIDKLQAMLITRGVDLSEFNFDHCKEFHPTFLRKQLYTPWFNDIKQLRESGVYSDFLDSHAIIQAISLLEYKDKLFQMSSWESTETKDLIKQLIK